MGPETIEGYFPRVHKGRPASIIQNKDNTEGSKADREGEKRKTRERTEENCVSPGSQPCLKPKQSWTSQLCEPLHSLFT